MPDSPIRLLRFESAVKHDLAVDLWFEKQKLTLGSMVRPWFELMRDLGDDVRELLHDGHPTACIGDAAFGYVNAFTAHVTSDFFSAPGSTIRRGFSKELASACDT